MSKTTKAHLAIIGANIIFGSNYAIVKFIAPSVIQPFALNVVRIITSLFLFWLLFLLNPAKLKIERKDIPRFILCALTGVVINQLFFIKGVSLTTSIHSSLLALATPIFITIIAAWLLRERFTLMKFTGLLLGISGGAVLVLMKDATHSGSDILLGDIMVLINAISYAFYLVLVRPLMTKYTGIQVLRWIFTFGAVVIIPFGMQQFLQTNWQAFSPAHWAALVFVGVGATFLAYLLNVYGVNAVGASATGAYIYTQPVFAAVIATLFAGEQFSLTKGVAALLIFAGVYLANFKKQTPPPQALG